VEYLARVPAIIAIDGPAGAGKSTVARKLARRLGFAMVDTGAIYRAVALAAKRAGIAWEDDAGLARLLDPPGLPIAFGENDAVFLDGEDVTAAIRTPEMSRGASVVSARPVVRERLLGLQRTLGQAAQRGAVLEGRDIGTVVFPDATVKFFLTAADEARARRRHAELAGKGHEVELSDVLQDQQRRDKDDTERAIAPLKPAPDAIVVDTTGLDLDQVVERCFLAVSDRVAA
jgi:cytidylate kinase